MSRVGGSISGADRPVVSMHQESHRSLVDGEDDAAGFADDAVSGSRWIDDECSGCGGAVLIPLRSGENDDVLVAGVFMCRDHTILAESDERGGGTGDAVAVKAVDFDSITERLPRNFIGMRCDAEEVGDFDARILGDRIGFHKMVFAGSMIGDAFRWKPALHMPAMELRRWL